MSLNLFSHYHQISISIVPIVSLESIIDLDLIYVNELRNANKKRKNEFLQGRFAAHQALSKITSDNHKFKIVKSEKGPPLFPPSFLGTIAHSEIFACAAVAKDSQIEGLGIDVETILRHSVYEQIKRIIFTEEEQALIQNSNDFLLWATLIFSAKESLYKCIGQKYERIIDFLEVEIKVVDFENMLMLCYFDNTTFSIDFAVAEQSVFTLIVSTKK